MSLKISIKYISLTFKHSGSSIFTQFKNTFACGGSTPVRFGCYEKPLDGGWKQHTSLTTKFFMVVSMAKLANAVEVKPITDNVVNNYGFQLFIV